MKNIKLSKTGWLILSVGIFIVVLAGLGMTRSQQLREQTTSSEELGLAVKRLDNLDVTDLRNQYQALSEKIELGKTDLHDAVSRLERSVVSADIAEEFYDIAKISGVFVENFTTTPISKSTLDGIEVFQTSISGSVSGTLEKCVNFVINVNSGFRTGFVRTAVLTVEQPTEPELDLEAATKATISIIVYSYQDEE